jgi:hypothetical protein
MAATVVINLWVVRTNQVKRGGATARCCWGRHADARRRMDLAGGDRGTRRRALGLADSRSAGGHRGVGVHRLRRRADRDTTRILSDRIVISETDLKGVVMTVPGVIGCHQIRTRGSADHVFLDLHVWMPPEMSLTDAHTLSHVVKDRLMTKYPQIADAIIHIEPPPA